MGSNRQPQGSPFYTLAEAAELFGVHYETVARWVRRGKLRGVKLSRRKTIIPKEECEALLSGSAATPSRPEVGSPQRWLALVGTLKPEEADQLLELVRDFEHVEEEI